MVDRLFYTLKELTDDANFSISDINHAIETNQLKVSALADWEYIDTGEIDHREILKLSSEEYSTLLCGKVIVYDNCIGKSGKYLNCNMKITIYPDKDRLIVDASELRNCFEGSFEKLQLTKQKTETGTETVIQRTRTDNLTKAILSAIDSLGGKPSFDELWQYFQDDRDESGIIVDYDDDALTWTNTKGDCKDTKKKTVANRLSRLLNLPSKSRL